MQHRRVGDSGLKVSAIALGSQTTFVEMRQSGVREVVRAAVEHGITTFDMADVYDKGEAERLFGYVVSGLRRQDIVIISKVGQPMSDSALDRGLSRKHILESIDGALVRLQTEYLDLYLCDGYDPETPVVEVAGAMDQLVRSGKILYWGTRGWSTAQIQSALAAARALGGSPPIADQSPYNLLDRRAEVDGPLAPGLARGGEVGGGSGGGAIGGGIGAGDIGAGSVGVMACRPLAGGVLTGKYSDGIPRFSRAEIDDTLRASLVETDLARVRRLAPIAADLGVTTAQLALAWVLTRPNVSCAVSGAMSSEQIAENAAAGEIVLGAEVLAAVEGAVGGPV